jgi:hypothetical protein
MAAIGAAITFVAVLIYAQLGVGAAAALVIVPLALIGIGGGFFRPANQVAIYATVSRSDFGSLSAMLTSIGTLAGTLGTTIMVAVSDSRGASTDPVAFAEAQQFTFALLLPLLVASVIVSLLGRSTRRDEEQPSAPAPATPQASGTRA